jgi:hypothetical protein
LRAVREVPVLRLLLNRQAAVGGVVLLALMVAPARDFAAHGAGNPMLAYSDLLGNVERGQVTDVYIQGNKISGHLTDGRAFTSYAPSDPSLVDRFMKRDVRIGAAPAEEDPTFIAWLLYGLGALLLWYLIARPLRAAVAVLIRIEQILAARAVIDGYAEANRAGSPGGAPTGN